MDSAHKRAEAVYNRRVHGQWFTCPNREWGIRLSKKRIVEATFVIILLGALSKVLGFAREQMIAVYFGATGRTDAYVVANTITVIITGLLSGPLSTAFLPVFASHVANDDRQEASRLASSVITISTLAVLGISIIAMAKADTLVAITATGFTGATFDDAVFLTRVFLPAMAIPLLSAFAKSILNTCDRFGIPALAPSIQNLVIVIVIGILAPTLGITSLTIAVVLGYLAALAIQTPQLVSVAGWPSSSLRIDESTKKVMRLAVPLMAGSLFSQLYLFVDKNLASHLPEGSIAALSFADRLRQVPLGLFVAAVVTVVYPNLSTMWAKKDIAGFKETAIMGLRYVEFICIPSALGLMVLARPLVRLVFEHGEFTAEATAVTASALVAYSPALVFMAATQVIFVAFYSSQDTRTPVMLSAATAVVNILLDLVLVRFFGHVGLAIANSLAATLGALVGLYALNRLSKLPLKSFAISLGKILVSSAVMAGVALALSSFLGFEEGAGSLLRDVITAGIVVGGAFLTYALVAALLRCEEMSSFIGMVKRRMGKETPVNRRLATKERRDRKRGRT